jgi:hypothetical protein
MPLPNILTIGYLQTFIEMLASFIQVFNEDFTLQKTFPFLCIKKTGCSAGLLRRAPRLV